VRPSRYRTYGQRILAASSLTLAFASCGSSDDRGSGGGSPAAGGSADEPASLSLRFTSRAAIVLKPRAEQTIDVEVSPLGAYAVRFALLPDPTDPRTRSHDGVLDRSEVLSDALGRARVLLTAPSSPLQLMLRASAGSVSLTKPVTVTASGTTTLRVEPRYTGPRAVTQWVASVHVGKRCEELSAMISDGDITGIGRTTPIEITNVPVGAQQLAVTLRAGQFLSGCHDQERVLEGEATTVFVPVNAVPLNLEISSLEVSIGLGEDDPALLPSLEASLGQAELALHTGAEGAPAADDIGALLDAMQQTLNPMEAQAFAAARASEDWDAELAADLDDPTGSELSTALTRWSTIGRSALLSPHAFEGRLRGSANVDDEAIFTIERVTGVAAAEFGVVAERTSNWEADASDELAFGGTLAWSPSKFSAGLAIAPALAETGTTSIQQALQRVYSCSVVADTLSSAGPVSGCDVACLENLCRAGLAGLWDRFKDFSGPELERLALTAAGTATVGEQAQATSVVGSWVGRLASAPNTSTGGPLRGWEPRPEAR
jgi:hypothetical protein